MQADQLIWIIVGVIAVLAFLFLIRLFRMPQDDRLEFPSVAAEQGPTHSGEIRDASTAPQRRFKYVKRHPLMAPFLPIPAFSDGECRNAGRCAGCAGEGMAHVPQRSVRGDSCGRGDMAGESAILPD